MQVLITRPIEDAGPLAAALEARGVTPVSEPLLTIGPMTDAAVALAGVQALLFTSANGVRAFGRSATRRDLTVLAVGDATAEAARAIGFSDVASAGGDVEDLAALAAARLDPQSGSLLHVAGGGVGGGLAGRLGAARLGVCRGAPFGARPAAALSLAAVTALG